MAQVTINEQTALATCAAQKDGRDAAERLGSGTLSWETA